MPNQQQAQPMDPPNQVAQVITQYGGLILAQMATGKDGATFADDLISMFGVPTHAAVAKYDEDIIIDGCKMVPQFWQQIEGIYGEAAFKKWIHDFKHYEEVLAEAETAPEGDSE
jgi:hypothetical protein